MNRPIQEMSVTSECVPNIGLRGRMRRAGLGVVWLAITVTVFILLLDGHGSPAGFLVIAPLAGVTAVYFLQAKEKT